MNKVAILTLYDYNYWANARILDAAAGATQDQFIAPANISHGTLRGALVHIFSAELVWRLRCHEGVSLSAMPDEAEFPTLEALVERWRQEEQLMRAYLNGLEDKDLTQTVRYQNTKGVLYENTLWHLLVHLVNHGTQTRSEAGVVLTTYGCSPGDLDMILFVREQAL